MKSELKKFLRNTLYTINKNPFSHYIYKKQVEERRKLPVTNVFALSRKINLFSPVSNEIHKPNDWYGHANILKKYSGTPRQYAFKFIVEHGFYLNDQVAGVELESPLESFVTYSNYRKNILEKLGKKVTAIGPLINYTNTHLTKKMIVEEKKRLGSCLVLFPFHSNPDLTFDYNLDRLCKEVKKLGRDFESVRVNLYWTDILHGLHKKYEEFGFQCVTAGHILDPLFLPRLKSIITLADFTVANNVSTPLSYCIALKKPHLIIDQRPKLSGSLKESRLFSDYIKSQEYETVLHSFSKLTYKITSNQRSIANKYCGTNIKISKLKFKLLIKRFEKSYQSKEYNEQ